MKITIKHHKLIHNLGIFLILKVIMWFKNFFKCKSIKCCQFLKFSMQYCLFIKGPTTLGVYTKVKSMFTTLKKQMSTNMWTYLTPKLKWRMKWQWGYFNVKCQCLITLKSTKNEHFRIKLWMMLHKTSKSKWLN